ncbi:hypothetical protein PAXINDRAFT_87666, partial [Paxillus involutus ATCC 200175]
MPALSTRTTAIPLAAGIPIPLTQSIPTLVPIPCQASPPTGTRPIMHRRKKAKTQSAPIEREDDEATQDALRPVQATDDALGLYNDPDAGDDVHNDPLLHTQSNIQDSDSETRPPS